MLIASRSVDQHTKFVFTVFVECFSPGSESEETFITDTVSMKESSANHIERFVAESKGEGLSTRLISLSRAALTLVGVCLLTITAHATDVKVQLAMESTKTQSRTGEPIILDLNFSSDTPGIDVRASNSNWPFSTDTIVLNPTQGVFPWYDDQVRGHPIGSDAVAIQSVAPTQQVTVRLTLTDLYRFDQEGKYRVHVTTNRTRSELTTNEVEFSFKPLPEKEESALAQSLGTHIRAALNMEEARRCVEQLDNLPGDAATRVKLSLFLHPKLFDPLEVDVTQGLWMARNRQKVVSALEAALVDPGQQVGFVELLAELKARLEVPYDTNNVRAPLPTKTLEADYIHQLAQTLPERTGEISADTARRVMTYEVREGLTTSPDFSAAREALIANFSTTSLWTLDTLLNQYGKYLTDVRILPALQEFLSRTSDTIFKGTRAAILAQMGHLDEEEVPGYIAHEACSEQPAPLRQVRSLTERATLPDVDQCLRARLLLETAPDAKLARRRDLADTLEYTARFATASLVPDVRAAYFARTDDWDQSARGAAVTYLMRWDAAHSLPLLTEMLPENDPSGAMWMFLIAPAYPPDDGLRLAFRKGLATAKGRAEGTYAYSLAQIGNEDDRQFIREKLEQFQSSNAWNETADSSMAEIDMIEAVNHGRNWEGSPEERAVLERSCVTAACKTRFAQDLSSQ